MIDCINNDLVEILSIDESVPTNESNSMLPTEFLNSLEAPGLPSHKLKLKVGTPCILIRNIDVNRGLCNGAKLLITSIGQKHIMAVLANGPRKGKELPLFKVKIFSNEDDFPFRFSRVQFPIKIAFAMTANKVQGQTLNYVGISLLQPFFTHGQLYVALSRVKSSANVKIICPEDEKGQIRTKNIVFKEVLN